MSSSLIAPLRLMLLDDHEVVRRGLELLLSQETYFEVAGSFTTSHDLFAALQKERADVLVVDYSLGPAEVDGLNLIRALRVRFPNEKILVVSAHYNAATVALAMKAGAKGFVGKAQGHKELVSAIRAVALGKTYLSPEMALEIAGGKDESPSVLTDERALTQDVKLSPREREVLRCYLDGMSVSQIAAKFSRSITTISAQKSAAFRKLGIRTDSELFKIQHLLEGK
ncbi:response regulator transcription factor [Dyella sp. GSA-30]|uniref:response regulator n=1 Tax=Dyella sp. GSA-30 TaxID=2994496 RepID=UPI00249092F3|nr:response regulator transcription factor [Dyella sp. GSA-30]BDU20030.1 DNA-binding response regulator [Dyella sp. GSA-30]